MGRSFHFAENTPFSSKPAIQSFCSNSWSNNYWTSHFEVQIVKILDQYGLEITIPSLNERERTSHVVISRGKSRFVDAIHMPKAKLRSSAELLSEFQNTEGGLYCLAQSKTSIQETGAAHVKNPTGNKETSADTLSIAPSQASLLTQETIPTTKRNRKVIPANSSYEGALSIAVSKMVTQMVRHHDQDE